jgi:hypothetical protein
MDNLNQIASTLFAALAGALGAYVAIRTDLADLKARMTHVEATSERAHERIDDLMKS